MRNQVLRLRSAKPRATVRQLLPGWKRDFYKLQQGQARAQWTSDDADRFIDRKCFRPYDRRRESAYFGSNAWAGAPPASANAPLRRLTPRGRVQLCRWRGADPVRPVNPCSHSRRPTAYAANCRLTKQGPSFEMHRIYHLDTWDCRSQHGQPPQITGQKRSGAKGR